MATILTLTTFITFTNTQPYEQFYNFDCDTSPSGWIFAGSGVQLTTNCPNSAQCWDLQYSSTATKLIPTTGYHDIKIILDARIDVGSGQCVLEYTTGGTRYWTTGAPDLISAEFILPDITDINNASNFQLKLSNTGTHHIHDHCYWDNIQFWGIPYTTSPTTNPTKYPTKYPTIDPTANPTPSPTLNPTRSTAFPTPSPTSNPTPAPTYNPTPSPTGNPSPAPTNNPTPSPTNYPTPTPTNNPTTHPSPAPTGYPTASPSIHPTTAPTFSPTHNPTSNTNNPTTQPTTNPTPSPILVIGMKTTLLPTPSVDTTEQINTEGQFNNTSEKSSNVGLVVGLLSAVACLCIFFSILLFCISKKRKNDKWDGKIFDNDVINIKISSQSNGLQTDNGNNIQRVISVSNDNEFSEPYNLPEIEPDGRYVIEMHDMDDTLNFKKDGLRETIEGDDDNTDDDIDICDVHPDDMITPRGDDSVDAMKRKNINKNNNQFKDDDVAMTLGLFASEKDKNDMVSDMLNNDTEIVGDDGQITMDTTDNNTSTQGLFNENDSYSEDSDDNVLHNDYVTTTGGQHITAGGPSEYDAVEDNVKANEIGEQFEMNELPINNDFAQLIGNEESNEESHDSDDEILAGIDTLQ